MAELLGIVAGGAGLASLAIQLGESSAKLKRIYKSYQEAPKLLGDLSTELETFVLLLHNLEKDRQQHDPVDRAIVDRCIQGFNRAVIQVDSAVTKFKLARLKSDFKGRFLTALGKTDLLQLRDELEKAKSSLILACQLYSWSCREKDNQTLQQLNKATTQILDQLYNDKPNNNGKEQLMVPVTTHESTDRGTIGVRKYKGPQHTPEKVMFEIVSRTRKASCHSSRAESSCPNWRLRFSPWFTARVWEISLSIAQSGFSFNVRTCNFVPDNALVFEVCQSGDMAEVQALFQSGDASPFDCSYTDARPSGQTVLSAAASSGNLQLCRFLVEIAGFPVCPDTTRDALSSYTAAPTLHKIDPSEAVEMYRLLMQQPGWDIDDLFTFRKGCPWWWACPDVACVRLVRDEYSLAFAELSWEIQVKIAIENSGHDNINMPRMFVEMLGCDTVDLHIAQAHDDSGLTALHMVAEKLTWKGTISGLETWVDFVRQLLAYGADIHQKDSKGDTPFMYLLSRTTLMPLDPSYAVRAWAKMLEALDINLEMYGWREMIVWNDRYPTGTNDVGHRIISWKYGRRYRHWTVNRLLAHDIPVFELVSAPGTFPESDALVCKTICWFPQEEDALDGPSYWSHVRWVTIYSKHKSPDAWYRQDDFSNILTQELNDTQDDCGAVLRVTQASSGICHPRRRYSQPTSRKTWRAVKTDRRWLPRCHICLEDNRLKFPMERRCFEHVGSPLAGRDRSSHYDLIKRQMHRFRTRFSDLEQLRLLPYAAYHPDWKRD